MLKVETLYNGKSYPSLDAAIAAACKEIEVNLLSFPPILRQEFLEFLQRITQNTVKYFIPFSKRNRGQQKDMQMRSGKTRSQILASPEVKDVGRGLYFGYVGGPKHLEINEFGGIQGPKAGDKFVYIPLDAALNARGLPIAKDPRNWKNTFIRKTRRGNLIIFQRRASGRPVPLYLLKRNVKIPPRLRMTRAIISASPYFERKVMDALERQFNA